MPRTIPQNLSNHVRLDPTFHFFLLPVFTISALISIVLLAFYPSFLHLWIVIFIAAVVILMFKTRLYALRVQDRVICLEEKLRMVTLLSDQSHVADLSERQLIALRFASDEEVPDLIRTTLSENLSPADIKKSIRHWRPDYWRV